MAQQGKSKLMAKYGAKLDQAVTKHADAPIFTKGGAVPSGITDGVAQLTECCFKQFEKGTNQKTADGKSAEGEYYFYAMGVVQEDFPNDKDAPTRGLQLRIGNGFGIPVFDTKKGDGTIISQDERILEIENEMKKLGIAKESFTGGDVLEDLAAALQEAQPFFKFSTSAGKATEKYPNPRTWENWNGSKGLEDYSPPDADSAVDDQTEASAPAVKAKSAPPSKPPVSKPTAKVAPTPEPEPEADVPFGDELDDLVAECNSDDVDMAADGTAKLSGIAEELGIDASTVDSWEEVAQLVRDARSNTSTDDGGAEEASGGIDYVALGTAAEGGDQDAADALDAARQEAGMDDDTYATLGWEDLATWLIENVGASGADETPAWSPEAGEVYKYKPVDPKTKKKVTKSVECEVVSVSGDTVTLKNLVDGKTIINPATKKALLVPWVELEQ